MKTLQRLTIILLAGFLLPMTMASAQDPLCLGVTQRALNTSETFCEETGRHQACYGHILIDAQLYDETVSFDEPGDITDITYLDSLKLSAFNSRTGEWGIAKLQVQADLPDAESDDVTILIFGDVQVDNAVPAVPVDILSNLPFYSSPTEGAEVVGELPEGSQIVAHDRLPGSSWIRASSDTGEVGWLDASGLTTDEQLNELTEVNPDSAFYHPMQAFYFTSGQSISACQAVPPDGLVIQTPEGAAEVNFLINEVDIQLGSTAFLQASPNGAMTISVLEGHASVTANGVQVNVTAGNQLSIPMSDTMQPTGSPGNPTAIPAGSLGNLPLGLLDQAVTGFANSSGLPSDLLDFTEAGGGGFVDVSSSVSSGSNSGGGSGSAGAGQGSGQGTDAGTGQGAGAGTGSGTGANTGNANGNNGNGIDGNGQGNNGNGNGNGGGNGSNGGGNGGGNN